MGNNKKLVSGMYDMIDTTDNIVAYLLKARTVQPEKQPLLGNGCVTRNNGMTVATVFSVRYVRSCMTRTSCQYRGVLRR
jgi:hypothetical protein